MSKRFLTDDEVSAVRMCHHDFGRLPLPRAAKAMGVTEAELRLLLTSARKKAPQMFPILTETQYLTWKCWDRIEADIKFLRTHGFIPSRKSSPVQLDLARHEHCIKEVF